MKQRFTKVKMAGVRWSILVVFDNKVGGGVMYLQTTTRRDEIMFLLEDYFLGNIIVDGAIEAHAIEIYPGNIPGEFETKIIGSVDV